MKKVININFQGRVIPIEESAYEELKNYTDSLRRYFAREEGRDEIINDIENRIAELFTERLKKQTEGCITDNDINEIIASIGRPEDFDGEGEESTTAGTTKTASAGSSSHWRHGRTTRIIIPEAKMTKSWVVFVAAWPITCASILPLFVSFSP